jgi:tetratricopeptide (TPR) repeat protein
MMHRLARPIRSSFLVSLAIALSVTAARAQDSPRQPASDGEIQTHFAAAQQAQREKDFATAEREYQTVISRAPAFAEVHMNLGLVYQLQNRYPEAMTEFRKALKLKPTLTGANFFLGVDHCKLGQGAQAIPYLKAAQKAQPGQSEIWLWLATAYEISGDIPAEVATMRDAVKQKPADIDFLYLLGHAYERLGKVQAALLENSSSDSSRKEQFLAESYAASNEWPSAVIHFQNAIAASPNRAGLHTELGEVLLHAGKVNQASKEFEAELKLDPQNLRALVRRGETELLQQNVNAALGDWDRALARDPAQEEKILGLRETGFGDSGTEQLPHAAREKFPALLTSIEGQTSPSALLAQSFLAAQNGAPLPNEKATSSAEPANDPPKVCSSTQLQKLLHDQHISDAATCALTALTPQTPTALRFQAVNAMLDSGAYENALHALESVPPAAKNSVDASYWRARCYEKLATAAYLRLYQVDPNSYRLHQLMGDISSAKNDDGKATEEYRAAIALKPSLPNLHYSLGHLLWKDLKVPEARVELEAELAINPHHAGALNDLGDTYLLEHQPDKALPLLTKALAADPTNPDIHRDLGTAYSELGDYRKAEEQLKLAVAGDHDGSVHYKLARAYLALGQKENAASEFALSTSLNRESHAKLEKQTERLAEITKSTEAP